MPREYAGTEEEQSRARLFLKARTGKAVRPEKFLAPAVAYLRWRDDGEYKGEYRKGWGGTTEHADVVALACEDFKRFLKPSRMSQFAKELRVLLPPKQTTLKPTTLKPKQTTLLQSFAAATGASAAHDRVAVLPSPAGALCFESPQAPRQPQQGPTDRTHPVIALSMLRPCSHPCCSCGRCSFGCGSRRAQCR